MSGVCRRDRSASSQAIHKSIFGDDAQTSCRNLGASEHVPRYTNTPTFTVYEVMYNNKTVISHETPTPKNQRTFYTLSLEAASGPVPPNTLCQGLHPWLLLRGINFIYCPCDTDRLGVFISVLSDLIFSHGILRIIII